MLSNSAAVLIISLLLFNAFGNAFVIWRLAAEAKHTFREQLKNGFHASAIFRLTFSLYERVAIVDDGRELLLNDVKYDIVSVEKTAANVTYHCVLDEQETNIINSFVKNDLRNPESGAPQSPAKRIYQSLIYCGIPPSDVNLEPDFAPVYNLARQTAIYSSPPIFILTPPPKA
jgi:hypothetical protein